MKLNRSQLVKILAIAAAASFAVFMYTTHATLPGWMQPYHLSGVKLLLVRIWPGLVMVGVLGALVGIVVWASIQSGKPENQHWSPHAKQRRKEEKLLAER